MKPGQEPVSSALPSEHFPMHPIFEKYYYWLQHCSMYLSDTPGRGGGREGGRGEGRGGAFEFFQVAQPWPCLLYTLLCVCCGHCGDSCLSVPV